MNYKKALQLAILATLPAIAAAEVVTVLWTNPTSYTDGSALSAASITRTRIEYGTCINATTFGTRISDVIATGSVTTANTPNLNPGTYCFRAYTTASGLESAPSSVASKVVVQPAPNPPSNVTIQ